MPDFADVKPSVLNWMIVTLMAILGISLAKFLAVRYQQYVPDGVQSVLAMV